MSEHLARDICGNHQWCCFHGYAPSYTPDKKEATKNYVYAVLTIFPCEKCRKHFGQNLKKLPLEPYLKNNKTFFLWTYLMHDMVNKENGKVSPPYAEMRDKWFKIAGAECEECSHI